MSNVFAFDRKANQPWPHTPIHMKGWEAFGLADTPDEITVRRLGEVTIRKGVLTTEEKPGTESWGPGEVKLGVAWVSISTSADSSDAFIQVVGTERKDVEARWHVARSAYLSIRDSLWPRSRAARTGGSDG